MLAIERWSIICRGYMGFLELLWRLIEWPLLGVLERSRLSRFFAVSFGVFALIVFAYSLVAPDSMLVGGLLAVGFALLSIITWKAGNWFSYKRAPWKAQEGMPKHPKRRRFDVVATKPEDRFAR